MDKRLTLEKRIKAELASYDGLMAVYVNDLKGNTLEIHCEEKFETASTIKTFILASLFEQVEKGNKSLTDTLTYEEKFYINGSGIMRDLDYGIKLSVKNIATLMIIISDNIATNMMIDYLGVDTINNSIQALGFKDTVLHNPIDFDNYRQLGTTTPRDYGEIYVQIAKGELISGKASQAMLDILKKQHYNSMLVREIPPYLLDSEDTGDEELFYVASKSGSMDACRNDGGIVSTPYGKYVIVLMNKNFSDPIYYSNHTATVFGGKVSHMIFDQYLALEGRLIL